MKCPLFLVGRTAVLQKGTGDIGECLKELCAWWDEDKGMCFRASQTRELRFIRSLLREIRDKIPHKKEGP